MSDKKTVRDELAELTEAVRELREDEVTAELRRLRAEVEKLRAERATHHCTGCSCMHIHYYPTYPVVPGCAPYVQPQIWCGTVTSGGVSDVTVTTTNVAHGAARLQPDRHDARHQQLAGGSVPNPHRTPGKFGRRAPSAPQRSTSAHCSPARSPLIPSLPTTSPSSAVAGKCSGTRRLAIASL